MTVQVIQVGPTPTLKRIFHTVEKPVDNNESATFHPLQRHNVESLGSEKREPRIDKVRPASLVISRSRPLLILAPWHKGPIASDYQAP